MNIHCYSLCSSHALKENSSMSSDWYLIASGFYYLLPWLPSSQTIQFWTIISYISQSTFVTANQVTTPKNVILATLLLACFDRRGNSTGARAQARRHLIHNLLEQQRESSFLFNLSDARSVFFLCQRKIY